MFSYGQKVDLSLFAKCHVTGQIDETQIFQESMTYKIGLRICKFS